MTAISCERPPTTVLQNIMNADVEALIGLGWHECSNGRHTYGNDIRDRRLNRQFG
jgi:hypothetical protein